MFSIFKSDRKKAIFTCSLFASSFFVGMAENMFGVILLDVMETTKVSYSASASYLIALDIGELMGSVVLGIVRQTSDPFIAMTLCTGVIAVSAAVMPWCTIYVTFFIACVIIGTPIGFLRPFQTAEIAAVWNKEGSRFMVILYVMRKVGTVCTILFISIFLSPISDVILEDSANNMTVETMQNTSNNLYIPFTSIAVIQLGAAFLFFMMYIWFRKHQLPDFYSSTNQEDTKYIRRSHKIGIYILIVAISGFINAFNYGNNRFIASFIVKEFHASRRQAAYVTVTYNTFAVVGRLLSLLAMKFFSNFASVFFCSFVMIIGSICLYLCSLYDVNLILVCGCVALVAMGSYPCSSLLPVVITESFFPVTRMIANIICFSGTFTDMMQSLLKGYLMEDRGAIQLNIIMIAEAVIIFILFVVLFSLEFKMNNQGDSETETTDLILKG